jgi:hypothetical protein
VPAAIPFIVQAVGTFLAVNATVVMALTIGASLAVGAWQARRAKKKAREAFNASLEDRLVSISTADGPRSRLYGRVRNSDGLIFKGTHGTNSNKFTLVVALAGHEVDEIETVYFNDQPLTLISDGVDVPVLGLGYSVLDGPFGRDVLLTGRASTAATGATASVVLPFTPVAGSVQVWLKSSSSAEYDIQVTPTVVGNTVSMNDPATGTWEVTYQYTRTDYYAKVWKVRGSPTQDLSAALMTRFPTLVTSSDKFSGIACLVVELTYSQDAFPSGPPQITAVVRGAKVHDPRSGLTAWTENPALIARDWALHPNGGACLPAEINELAFIAAANACDTVTVFQTTAGTQTRPLYQAGIVCSLGRDVSPEEPFAEIVEAMAGEYGWSGGRLTVAAGVYRAPVAAIDDTWLSGADGLSVIKDPPRNDMANVLRPRIADAGNYVSDVTTATSVSFTAAPLPEVRSDVFIAADGQELPRDVDLGAVTRQVHAQHVCAVMLRRMRDGMVVELPVNMKAYQLELFDTVTLTLEHLGFVNKLFEIIGWTFSTETLIKLTLRETDPSIYNVNAGLNVLNAAQNTTLPSPYYLPPPTNVTLTAGASVEDATAQTRVLVTWDPPPSEAVRQSGKIEIQFVRMTGGLPSGDWPSMTVEGNSTSATVVGLIAGSTYTFRLRSLNTIGVRSVWSLHKTVLVTIPAAVAAATNAAANAAAAIARLNDIASDSLLTPDEKPRVIQDRDVIVAEQADIDAKAAAQAITTEKTAYDNAVAALVAYLATLTTPVAWNNLAGNTAIVGVTFRQKFQDVYTTRQTLLNLMAVKIANGAVGTEQLAPSAATEVASSSVEDFTFNTPTDDPRGTLVKELASITYSNTGSQPIVLEATGTVSGTFHNSFVAPSTGYGVVYAHIYAMNGNTIITPFSRQSRASFTPQDGESPAASLAVVWQYVLPPATTVSLDLVVRNDVPAGKAVNLSAQLRVAVIKR